MKGTHKDVAGTRALSGIVFKVASCAVLLALTSVASIGETTNVPGSVSGGTGAVGDIQTNDHVPYSVAKSATATIGGFSSFGGTITSVYLLVEYQVDDGYSGTGALKINGTDTSILPADGDRVQQVYIDITGGSFGIDTSAEITSMSLSFANNDGGSGDSIHFDYIYLLINPTLPIHMQPTWSDEFSGSGAADSSSWWYEEGYQRNNEWQYYQTGSQNGWQSNGLFVIQGREEMVGGYDYTSASIRSEGKYSWMYGRAQIRAQLPCFNGMWPAIWMVGDSGEWPSNGECDIMEWYGNKTLSNCARGTTTRWVAAWDAANMSMSHAESVDPNWRTSWHIWTIQWDQDNVRLYCDNKLMNTTAQSWLVNPTTQWGPLEPFKQPHSLWLNLAIGGNAGGSTAGTTFPQHYYVDYWRVWESVTNNVAPTDIHLSANVVDEGLPAGTVIGNLTADDADVAEVLRYTLVGGAGSTDNGDFEAQEFVSDNTTMTILKTAAVLDYADGATRSIRVRVTDIEGATYDKIFTINVIPEPAIDVSTNSIVVSEGGTTGFQVKLRTLPSNTVTVNVSRASGDVDLSVSAGSQLLFTPVNGTNWQAVTIAAAEDPDWVNGAAQILCQDAAAIYSSAAVSATESDNDNSPPVVEAGTNQTISIGAASDWTPAHTNTAAWYDAADSGTITASGGFVSQWNDKSGNARHMVQAIGTDQPAYATNSWDGLLPALTFDSASDYLEHATRQTESTVTLALMMEQVNTSRDDRAFGLRGVSSGSKVNFAIACDNSLRYDGDKSDANMISPTTGKHMRVATRTLSLQTDFHDGSSNLLSSLTLPDVDGYINAGNTSAGLAGAFGSKIAEAIIMYEAISDETRQKIEGYLAHKWGLEGNLPAGHTYKLTPPTDTSAIATLNGVVTDPNGDPVTSLWTVVSGPPGTVFGDASSTNTTATFVHPGTYVLRLTSNDHLDQSHDEVTIIVTEPGADTVNLTVSSAHGSATPSGLTTPLSNSVVNISIAGSPVVNETTQYVATGWIGTGSAVGGSGTSGSFTITTDSTVIWQWETNYWIDFGVSGAGTSTGSLDQSSAWRLDGSNLTATATPDIYSQFDYWSGDTNGAAITANQITFSVNGPRSIQAVFREGITGNGSVPFAWLAAQNPAWTNDYEAAVTNDPDTDGFYNRR